MLSNEAKELIHETMEKRMKEARDSNDTIQQSRRMTRDERAELAIDQMTKELKDHCSERGKEITADKARRLIVDIARQGDRKAGK